MITDIELFLVHHDYFCIVHSVYIVYVIWTIMSDNKLSVIVIVIVKRNMEGRDYF